jgi:hypothetical protein
MVLRIAYADPPYLGSAAKHYADKHERAGDYDTIEAHRNLISDVVCFDGWAVSMSSTNLRHLLPLFPTDARVAAWVKPFCSFKPNVTVAYAWEPVVFKPARKRPRTQPTVRDWVSANILLKKGLAGAKPPAFCSWLINLLAIEPQDDIHDLFPGTGSFTTAVDLWRHSLPLAMED